MNAKENSRKSFDLQAATYDIDRNGSHARTAYGPVMDISEVTTMPPFHCAS
ncbi:MAG: hypothetical protein IAC23_07465 [Bacteroidetes bacterium]|uniref:Uncharacterized protein n=1 Tax=Candidatus Cryptobacteroides merdavium TaxID=2840769 RepID=A0A9D9HC67_9BACT|nr:hypothetical protein [Candidatus Cryptobacteroides merdavium]